MTEQRSADTKRFHIDFELTGEWAEAVQEMMFDHRTTDPNEVAKYALALLAQMREHGKLIVPDQYDDWGNNMVYEYPVFVVVKEAS